MKKLFHCSIVILLIDTNNRQNYELNGRLESVQMQFNFIVV